MSDKAIVAAISSALGKQIPSLVSGAVDDLAAKEDDPLVSGVLGVIADFVKMNGTDAIETVGENIQALIDGSDPMAAYKLEGDGLFLSDLVDALQGAEAERKAKASRMRGTDDSDSRKGTDCRLLSGCTARKNLAEHPSTEGLQDRPKINRSTKAISSGQSCRNAR